MMMSFRNGAAAVVAGAVAAGVLSLGAVASAEAGGPVVSPQTVQQKATTSTKASKQASKKVSRKAALKRAKKAEKRARARVAAAEKAVRTVRDATAGPRGAYEVAAGVEASAKDAAAVNAQAIERAKYLLGNEQAIYQEWATRAEPVFAAEKAARDAVTAANAVVTGIRNAVQDIQSQINTAYNDTSYLFNVLNDFDYNQIPAATGVFNTAWADEQSAWTTKEYYRDDFERRKAQWYNCRVTNGKWECKSSAGASWQWVPKLDEVQALLNQWQATYNENKNRRQDAEAHLSNLNAHRAAAQAAYNDASNRITTLTAAKKAKEAEYPAANAAVDAANKVLEEKRAALDVLYAEAEALFDEIVAAEKALPGLEAAQPGLDQAVVAASSEVARLLPAHRQAESKVTGVESRLVKARAALKKAAKRVKALSKKR